jgi:hypothetical protein
MSPMRQYTRATYKYRFSQLSNDLVRITGTPSACSNSGFQCFLSDDTKTSGRAA